VLENFKFVHLPRLIWKLYYICTGYCNTRKHYKCKAPSTFPKCSCIWNLCRRDGRETGHPPDFRNAEWLGKEECWQSMNWML